MTDALIEVDITDINSNKYHYSYRIIPWKDHKRFMKEFHTLVDNFNKENRDDQD